MPPFDLGVQLDISFRLLVASVLGAAIGLERELHAHPAGMRTHLLVSLGSAAFTVLSIFFFQAPGAERLVADRSVADRRPDRVGHRLPRRRRDPQVRHVGARADDGGQPLGDGRRRHGRRRGCLVRRGRDDGAHRLLAGAAQLGHHPSSVRAGNTCSGSGSWPAGSRRSGRSRGSLTSTSHRDRRRQQPATWQGPLRDRARPPAAARHEARDDHRGRVLGARRRGPRVRRLRGVSPDRRLRPP